MLHFEHHLGEKFELLILEVFQKIYRTIKVGHLKSENIFSAKFILYFYGSFPERELYHLNGFVKLE